MIVKPRTGSWRLLVALLLVPASIWAQAPLAHGTRSVVVLDAAHGGDDSGGQLGRGLPGSSAGESPVATVAEKSVTLTLSVRLRSLLAARGFAVVTTRESNVNLDADARAQVANHALALACLSLHATESGTGVHVFVSSLAPKDTRSGGRFLAWKTAQAGYVTQSLKLASVLNSAFEQSVAGGSAGSGSNAGVEAAAIPVSLGRTSLPGVDSMACPAVSVEVAPVRGADRQVVTDVTDTQYQTRIVEALAAALMEWRTEADTEAASHPKSSGGPQP